MSADSTPKLDIGLWGTTPIAPGSKKRVRLEVGESYTGLSVRLPLLVWRAKEPGPTVFVTSAVHGDEINGTGTIREMVKTPTFTLKRGNLLLVPVVNVVGFERHNRYMPDRRDLNRSFPGNAQGSISARLARLVFDEVVRRCDYGIDLHTASIRRTNYPNLRADMAHQGCAKLAQAFGCEVIMNNKGPEGSLRRAATDAGVPTIVLEAGEVWKVEPTYLATALRGIRNCLIRLGMVEGHLDIPPVRAVVETARWVRAGAGGFLRFHVTPGEVVEEGKLLASNTGLLGMEQEQITAPFAGVVIGMTTMPAVSPGDPVLHLAKPSARALRQLEEASRSDDHRLEHQVRGDLATNIHMVEPESPDGEEAAT